MKWQRIRLYMEPGLHLVKGDNPPEFLKWQRPNNAGQMRVGEYHYGEVGVQVSELFWRCYVTGEQLFPTHYKRI